MPGRVVSRRFVGRGAELARLTSLLAGIPDRPAIVTVSGTAGIGTSRLVDEALGHANEAPEPPLVIRGRSFGPADPPYAAVLAALDPILSGRPAAELAALLATDARGPLSRLPGLGAVLADVPGPPTAALDEPGRRQPRALEAVVSYLRAVSERRPLLVVLEDLHLADAATRAFATFVARIVRDERIGLLVTYQPDLLTRDHPLREGLAEIEAGPRPPARIELGRLGRREITELVESIEGERPSASVVVLVAERSAGSPLLVEELVAARRELHSASLTGSLTDLVAARLARRTLECRRVLRLLAMAERPVSRDRLATAAATFEADAPQPAPRSTALPRRGDGTLEADLAAGLAEALEHGFVRDDDDLVQVRHELIARSIVADLLPRLRPRHRVALATAFADEPAIAATHWYRAHRLEEARAAAVEAARQAEAMVAPEDALRSLELALELSVAGVKSESQRRAETAPRSETGPSPATPGSRSSSARVATAELERRAADLAFAARRPLRAVAFAEAALASFGERRDPVQHALLEARLGRYRLAAGDGDGAATALRRAAEVMPRRAGVERVRVLASLAQERMIAGAFREAERWAQAALAAGSAVGPAAEPEVIHATTTLGVVHGWGDNPELGVTLLREAQTRATSLGLLDERYRATANLTTVLDLLGRREEAVDVAYAGIEQARRAGLQAVYGNALGGNVADTLFALGRWDEARRLSLRALDWSPAGISFVNAIVNLVIVEIESTAGEEAGRLLGRILVELETGRDVQFAVPAYQAAASLALWSGDLADARRAVERGWGRLGGTEDWVLVARMAATALEVEAAIVAESLDRRRIGDVAAARERASRVLAEAEAAIAGSGVADALGSRREAEAHLEAARAFHARLDGRDDPEAWDDVAERWIALGDPYRAARARWRQAEAILAPAGAGPVGREGSRVDARAVRAEAREPIRQAVEAALALRARPLLRELRELAGRALIALPPEVDVALQAPPASERSAAIAVVPVEPVPAGPAPSVPGGPHAGAPAGDTFGLSRRELEVLGLIAQGRTNREIGDRLFISQKTVGVHVGNILAKLGVSGRVEAAAVAIRLGIGEPREVRPPRR